MKQFLNAPAKLGTRTPIVSASTFLTITTIFNLQHYYHEESVPLMMLTMKVTLEVVGKQHTFVGLMQAYLTRPIQICLSQVSHRPAGAFDIFETIHILRHFISRASVIFSSR